MSVEKVAVRFCILAETMCYMQCNQYRLYAIR